jgi:hypothetical protein
MSRCLPGRLNRVTGLRKLPLAPPMPKPGTVYFSARTLEMSTFFPKPPSKLAPFLPRLKSLVGSKPKLALTFPKLPAVSSEVYRYSGRKGNFQKVEVALSRKQQRQF